MAGFFDDIENTTSPVGNSFFDDIEATDTTAVDPNASDFIPGVKRGLQNLQASAFGATALAGSGLKKLGMESAGQAVQDFGMEGYNRNIEEAKQFPKKYTFKDVYTGEAGIGGAIDWAQGTIGELVPSMAEAAIGALAGSAVAPGPGTVAGGLAARTVIKKGIDASIKQALKRGIGDLTEDQLRKQVTKQALKKFGGKVGIAGAVMPLESGGMYAELLESNGVDAPETALFFGALATSLEFAGGNSKLVDTFVDALSKGATGTVKKSAKELLSNIPQEALQEGGQELLSVLNTVANTDEKLLTADNVERIVESMAAGAVGGGVGAVVNAAVSSQATDQKLKTDEELELDRRAGNILSQKDDDVSKSIQKLTNDIKNGNELLTDPIKLDKKARELNISQTELIKNTLEETKNNQSLLDIINAGIKKKEEDAIKKEYETLSPEEKEVRDIENKLNAKRQESAIAINDQINSIDDKIAAITKRFNQRSLDNPVTKEEQQKLSNDYIQLNQEKNKLLDRYKEEVVQGDFAPYTTREERQKVLENLFGTANRTLPSNKDAAESFQVFEANNLLPVEMANYANGLVKLKAEQQALDSEKQALKPIEENNLKQIEDYVNYIRKIGERFTPPEQAIIENYWQSIKKILDSRNEEMTPGTEAFMRKKFFETQLDKIENNVRQDAEAQVEQNKNVVPTLAEQNKRQQMFQQIAMELGDIPVTNRQAVTPEIPRDLPGGLPSAFTNEQQVGEAPQFQIDETQFKSVDINSSNFRKWFAGSKVVDANDKPLIVYHGTMVPITEFQSNYRKGEQFGFGIHFTDDPEFASRYANKELQGRKKGFGNVIPVYVNAKNILNADKIVVEGSPEYTLAYKLAGRLRPQLFANQYTENGSEKTGKKEVYLQHAIDAAQGKTAEKAIREAGYDGIWYEARVVGIPFAGHQTVEAKARSLVVFDPAQIKSAISNTGEFSPTNQNINFAINEKREFIKQVTLADIQKAFPGQTVTQAEDGTISVQFKNGKGLTINSIQTAGQDYISLAIETGQMSKTGKILGITVGNKILLNDNFADNKTLWHENKHVLDNLGLITTEDDAALNREFNKLRKQGKLKFALSTHKDPVQAMAENRANMFAQIMVDRDAYRNTAFGKVIQRVMDFFNQLLSFGKQTVSGLAREVESGRVYERKVGDQTIKTTVPMLEETAAMWHSTLENAVAGFQQKIATPDQWKGMIKSYPGVKQEELDWIGLDEWLDSKDRKVSKEELAQFIAENNVRLEEVVKGWTVDKERRLEELDDRLLAIGDLSVEEQDEYNNLVNEESLAKTSGVDTKYSNYQLPEGKNYQELLITLLAKYQGNEEFKIGDKVVGKTEKADTYKSSHWDEPNILTHIRFNERTDVDGNSVLFIEEVQSDWHQEGRKGGYKSDGIQRDEVEILELPFEEAIKRLDSRMAKIIQEYMPDYRKENNIPLDKPVLLHKLKGEPDSRFGVYYGKPLSPDQFFESVIKVDTDPHTTYGRINKERSEGVADAPFKKSWPLLAMKRMVRYAAENGFDKIAWTTGEQQANRYDLSKHISEINYERDTDGSDNFDISATGINGNEVISEEDINLSRIEEIFGKEIAKKIENNEGADQSSGYRSWRSLSGLDLQVGGEGMKGFYDQMLPSMLNKEFNRGKWGNARVEEIQIGENKIKYFVARNGDPMYGYDSLAEAGSSMEELQKREPDYVYSISRIQNNDAFNTFSLPITNRMKSKALREGMPMFDVRNRVSPESKNFKTWFKNSKVVDNNGSPLVVYHSTTAKPFNVFKTDVETQNFSTKEIVNRKRGAWFTDDPNYLPRSNYYDQNKFYLSLQNPLDMRELGEEATKKDIDNFYKSKGLNFTATHDWDGGTSPIFDEPKMRMEKLQQAGYDGVILKEQGGATSYIAFNPEQIKSVDNLGTWSSSNPNVYFQVREEPTQKISDDVYQQMFAERNNLVRTIGQTLRMRGHEIKQLIDKGLGSISTRLKNVDPMLRSEIRNLDFRTAQKIVSALRIAHPLLDKTKAMDPKDRFIWDVVRRNADDVRVKQIAEKYGMAQDLENLRNVLNQIRQDAIDVGYDVGFIEEYWPRIIKDQEGFLQATKGISQRPVITDAIKKYADKLGMTVEAFEATYPEQAADIASNTILGRNIGIGGPGNIQERVYDVVPPELNKFYMDSDAALMQYIYSMTKKIEARRFFGKVPERIANLKTEKKRKTAMLAEYERTNNTARIDDVSADLLKIEQELDKYKLQRDYTENIGTYINDLRMTGRIQAEDEKVVRDILDARFHEHGTTGIVNAYKNMAYIDVMGSPISALTQIGDLAWAMYVGKVWTPRGLANTVKNFGKATSGSFKNSKYLGGIYKTFGGSEITKEDLGIERIAQEFADGTTLGNAVSWVFKKVQLERIDSIGKETLINNAFDNYKSMASTEAGRAELLKQLKPIFGTQSESVINDLLANTPSDNVKMLLYHRLLDFQPVALSEMSEQYLKSGNGRVFYMLKTYTLKQFDVFRNEAWHKIKSGEKNQVIEGITNMIKLTSLLTLANAGSDELKDFLLGKDTKFEDHVVENFLTMGGASKYVRMQTTREGLGSGLIGQILPPFRFVNSVSKDINQAYDDYIAGDTISFNNQRIVESIPIAGKLYYWHYGRGTDYKKSSNEQEFSKVGKEVNIFKRQLENSEDKRTFLNSNLDKFKQMKLHENFQASLNRNQAVINKLKDLEQTTNVRERLGQLQQQREMILNKYFEVTKGMTQ